MGSASTRVQKREFIAVPAVHALDAIDPSWISTSMRIVRRRRFEELSKSGQIVQSGCHVLSDSKIGLRVAPIIGKLPSTDAATKAPVTVRGLDVRRERLVANRLYL